MPRRNHRQRTARKEPATPGSGRGTCPGTDAAYRASLARDRALRGTRQITTRHLRIGDVVRARVPFRDSNEDKCRPVVIVGIEGDRVSALYCTTSTGCEDRPGYVPIGHAPQAGLRRRTYIYRSNPIGLERVQLIEVLGHLGPEQMASLGVVAADASCRATR